MQSVTDTLLCDALSSPVGVSISLRSLSRSSIGASLACHYYVLMVKQKKLVSFCSIFYLCFMSVKLWKGFPTRKYNSNMHILQYYQGSVIQVLKWNSLTTSIHAFQNCSFIKHIKIVNENIFLYSQQGHTICANPLKQIVLSVHKTPTVYIPPLVQTFVGRQYEQTHMSADNPALSDVTEQMQWRFKGYAYQLSLFLL